MIEYIIFLVTAISIFGIYTLSLNLQWGEAGVANLGPIAFMAIGGYTTAILSIEGFNLYMSITAGILASSIVGALLGYIGARLKDEFFGLLTLGFAHTLYLSLRSQNPLSGGASGIHGFQRPFNSLVQSQNYELFFMLVSLGVLTTFYVFLQSLKNKSWGRALNCLRDDELAAKSLGKRVKQLKLEVMMVGSAISGIAGIMLIFDRQFISPDTFGFELTLYGWLAMILGGSANNKGVILGTVVVFGVLFSGTRIIMSNVGLPSYRVSAARLLLISTMMIILMIWRPQGIMGDKEVLTIGK